MSLYQKLYPNLNFKRSPAPSTKTMNVTLSDTMYRSSSQPKTPRQEPVIEQKPEIVEKVESPVKKQVKPKRKVVIREEIPQKPDSPVQEVIVQEKPKPKAKRPNRVKPEPLPAPERLSTIPKKGEQGLQPKYSFEQKKQIYLDKLSRKSVKNAEREVNKVQEVLAQIDHDPEKLKAVEKEMKSRLKLINTAKYFAESKKVVEPQQPSPQPPRPVTPPPPTVPPETPDDDASTQWSSDEESE